MAIAATIYNEARGEPPEGRQAVKAVIQNRMSYKCPHKHCGYNHKLHEWRSTSVFHGYSTTEPDVPEAEKPIWRHCKRLAGEIVADNTNGATHFQRAPFNTNYFEPKGQIGRHYFAREKTEITRHKKAK
jgi:hypothetical protein